MHSEDDRYLPFESAVYAGFLGDLECIDLLPVCKHSSNRLRQSKSFDDVVGIFGIRQLREHFVIEQVDFESLLDVRADDDDGEDVEVEPTCYIRGAERNECCL